MARKFFYVCAGMLMLAIAYHLGANNASAQVGGTVVGITGISDNQGFLRPIAVTQSGDVYYAQLGVLGTNGFTHAGNIFSGAPTPARQESWGQLKARYATPPSVSKTPAPTDR